MVMDDVTLSFDLIRKDTTQVCRNRNFIKYIDQLALSVCSRLLYWFVMMVYMLFQSLQAWEWSNVKIHSKKILFICHFSPKLLPCHASCYIHTGDVYCDEAAILLRAESGGEVIAWLACGKPSSSIHLSLSFIIQLYLFPAAKLFII